MFNGLAINPAYTGVNGHFNATMVYRNQWVNLPGAPSVKTFSAHSNIKDKNIGLGMLVYNDKVGIHSETGMFATYAYHVQMPNGKLSMGVQAGFNALKSDFSELNIRDINDPSLTGNLLATKMNFGTGVYYHNQVSYIGLSVPYLRKKRTIKDDGFIRQAEESTRYYVNAGTILDLSPRLKMKPSGLLKVESGMPIAADLNVNFYLDDVLTIGGSYRTGESFISLFEIKVSDYIRFGYAYDWTTNDLAAYSKGTHEFMLNYRINFYAPKRNKMCPGPFYW
jgi:type IX secretion system PorP/SprF family membrane protein